MSRPRLAALATATAAAASLSLAVPALAVEAASSTAQAVRTVAAADPEDVGNRLDIVRERVTVDDNGTITLRIRTAETWRCDYLQDFGERDRLYSAGLLWDFDRGADGSFGDLVGSFDCDGDRLVFRLHDVDGDQGDRSFRASRPTASSAVVTFPTRALAARHLALRAVSRFNGSAGDHTAFEEDDHAPVLRAY